MRLICFSVFSLLVFSSSSLAQPGALITGFGQSGFSIDADISTFHKSVIQPSTGKIIVANNVQVVINSLGSVFGELRRYNTDGTLDASFGDHGHRTTFSFNAYYEINDIAALSTGQIVAITDHRIYRFDANGNAESSHPVVIPELPGIVSFQLEAVTVDAFDRIVVVGQADIIGNDIPSTLAIFRFNADGSYDTGFNGLGIRIVNYGTGKSYRGKKCTTDANNKIVVWVENTLGGNHFDYESFISRYNDNGNVDVSFANQGTYSLDEVPLSIQTDVNGKFVVATNGAGNPVRPQRVFRLNATGGSDSFIYSGSSPYKLSAVTVQPDGKVVLAGYFSTTGNSSWLRRSGFSGGEVTTQLLDGITPLGILYYNRRLYVTGNVANWVLNSGLLGLIAAYDGSDVRMSCPTPANPYSVDAANCYATINNINAVMSSLTLWANVQNSVEHNGITTTGEGGVAGQHFQPGTTNITYSYTDITTQTCSFSVTVVDNVPPVAKAKNITVPLDATGHASITAAQVNDGSSDPCGIKSLSLNKTSFSCADAGANTVTLTVTDNHDNVSTATATVTISDNIPPVAKCKNITVQLDAAGLVSITPSMIDNGSTDACALSFGLDKTSFNCSNVGANAVTLTVSDHDNQTTCGATVTVQDNIAPLISNASTNPLSIWPVNRKMTDVTVSYNSNDNCPGTVCRISTIAIVENGVPLVSPDDWQIVDATHVRLKATRTGNAARSYFITIRCTDASGNTTTAVREVPIVNPHQPVTFTRTGNVDGEALLDHLEAKVYPQVTAGNFNISVGGTNSGKLSFEVFDGLGRLVLSKSNFATVSGFSFGSNFKPGIYYVRVMEGEDRKEWKLIKL